MYAFKKTASARASTSDKLLPAANETAHCLLEHHQVENAVLHLTAKNCTTNIAPPTTVLKVLHVNGQLKYTTSS
jgi:hypothetical protein